MEGGTCAFSTLGSTAHRLLRREEKDPFNTFLDLVSNQFSRSFATDAFLASLGTSLGISAFLFLLWSLLRPHHSRVYAPKLRYAATTGKTPPPPPGKGYFSWLRPIAKCHEDDLVDKIGMDAVLFLRFTRFCRTVFAVLTVLGCCIMIPVNVTCNLKDAGDSPVDKAWYWLISPRYLKGKCVYAHLVMAVTFTGIVLFLLWRNYRKIVKLRIRYFESPEYMNSLHARSLMIWDVPKQSRSDAGLNKIIGDLKVVKHGDEKCAIGRNVKDLPELIEKHTKLVHKLEKVLAKYFRDPDNLPPRPTCRPERDDKTMNQQLRVDAIQYYRTRVEELEGEILIIRNSIDQRDAMPYGFVSYPTVSRAHHAAKAARGKHPQGTSIQLAARPRDIIWENLRRPKSSRRWNAFIGNLLFFLLSLGYVVPNALIAVFLSNMHNITILWPKFQDTLSANPKLFAVIQGVAAPTVTSMFYLILPAIMRKISIWAGDITRSSRDRHVISKLYFFFVLNNLIIFAVLSKIIFLVRDWIWKFETNEYTGGDLWASLKTVPIADQTWQGIVDISGFWITYLLQRNMGAMLDLAQVLPLIAKSFNLHFRHPTPRQIIEWSAPPRFDYASYYNYFLFYLTVALVFSTIQPLVLPVGALYFTIDSFLKKYALMYVFITKVESGGTSWRVIFNRVLVALILFNLVIALLLWTRSASTIETSRNPLLLIPIIIVILFIFAFKFYCRRAFDEPMRFHLRGSDRESIIATEGFKRKDNLEKRYSHPAIHSKLIKPMVAAKVPPKLLESVLYGDGSATSPGSLSSDYEPKPPYAGDEAGIPMRSIPLSGAPEKSAGYELVREEDMDFANFQHRAEFAEQGEYAGSDTTSLRTATPPPMMHHSGFGMEGRPGSPLVGGGYTPVAPRSPSALRPVRRESFDAESDMGVRLLGDRSGPGFGTPAPSEYRVQEEETYGYFDQPTEYRGVMRR